MSSSPWAFTDRQAWDAKMERFDAESGGVARAFLIDRKVAQYAIAAAADDGDLEAIEIAMTISASLASLQEASRLCLFCNHRFTARHTPSAFIVFLPEAKTDRIRDGCMAVASGLCAGCLAAKPTEQLLVDAAHRLWSEVEILRGFE